MKQCFRLFLCLCLLFLLTACGTKDSSSSNSGSRDGTDTENSAGSTDSDKAENEARVRIGTGSNSFGVGDSALRSELYSSENGSTGKSSSTYERMLRNGRVRDTDGDLTDGENALRGVYGRSVAE